MTDKILKSFDVWIAAQGWKSKLRLRSVDNVSLEGIARLRELILELGVTGKLVPQTSDDEPASAQLRKISIERETLIGSGKLKRAKALPNIETGDIAKLPKGWAGERFGNIFNVINGRAYKMHEMLQEGTPLLRVGNLFTSSEWYYSDLELEPEKYIDNDDLIYAWSASFGPFIWQGGRAIYHYHIWKLDPFSCKSIDKKYFLYYLSALTKSIKNSGNGIAMIHMTKERMERLVVAFPPLTEQHRIVAKIDELMALCDELEEQESNHLKSHQLLAETLLITLTQAKDAPEFQTDWAKLAQHFDDLFITEDSIDQLKQTILQLAVMGKLVPQEPSDEPASVLLEEIAKERERLIGDGTMRRQKQIPVTNIENNPFGMPIGWARCRLGEIINLVSGQHLKPEEYSELEEEGMIPYLTGPAEFGDVFPIPTRYTFEKRATALINDILITCKGSGVGKLNIANGEIAISRQLMAIQPILINGNFIKLVLESLNESIREKAVGIAIPGISREDITETIIHVPPEAEHLRIVTKVVDLFALCDRLKERIIKSQNIATLMANSILAQVV